MKTAIFGQFDNFRPGVFDRNGKKAHLRTKTFHLSLYQVSITFRSKVLARTSSSLEKIVGYFGQFDNFRSDVFLPKWSKGTSTT